MNTQRQSFFSFPIVGVPIRNIADYSPFGVQLDGRTVSMDSYRYGFNGMEGDLEFKGQGNSYTTEFRQYDARLGRWLSLDPLMAKFPNSSPYNFCLNNPINLVDDSGQAPTDPPNAKISVYQVWYDDKGNRHQKYLKSYKSENLKQDLVKFVYTETEVYNPLAVDYNIRNANGEIVASTGLYKPDDKPSTRELNEFFATNAPKVEEPAKPEPTFTEKVYAAAPYLKPGYFEGSYDSGNSGGRLSGKTGWDNGGKQLTFGIVGVLTAPFTIFEGGVVGIIGYAGLANSSDDVLGSVTNDEGKSLSQQLTTGTNYEGLVNNTKIGITFLTAGSGCYSAMKSVNTKSVDANFIPSAIGTLNDANSINNSCKSQKK